MALQQTSIGKTALQTVPLGVGAWAWGDEGFWGYGKEYGQSDVAAAFDASLKAGIRFFDTAELYGNGESERLLGYLARTSRDPVLVASKFAPLPWRVKPQALQHALDHSLHRLGLPYVDLYQIHWPFSLLSIDVLMNALADAVAEGKARAVGVSNYSADQMRRAHDALARRGVPLASNQVEYSLLKRSPEINGVLNACRELHVTLIAYSPLAQGLLTGKYSPTHRPQGVRSWVGAFSSAGLYAVQPVIELLREIGQDHDGKTPAQVALNWLIGQGNILPIPGAKNAQQACSNAEALTWTLSEAEREVLSIATSSWRR